MEIAQTGLQFDRSTPEGKLFATIMAGHSFLVGIANMSANTISNMNY